MLNWTSLTGDTLLIRARALLIPLTLAAAAASPDSIVIAGERIDSVYIVESARAVYVCNPADGTARSIAKTDPALGEVALSTDRAAREAWRAEYQARKTARDHERLGVADRPATADMQLSFEMGSPPPTPIVRSPATPELRLKGEPGSASRLALGVLGNASGSQNAPGGGNPGIGSGGGGGGGAFAGSGQGGMAAAGNAGGGGAGGGAGGGGGGNRQGGVAGFRNISDLFSNIDDAEVGETPNPITGR